MQTYTDDTTIATVALTSLLQRLLVVLHDAANSLNYF